MRVGRDGPRGRGWPVLQPRPVRCAVDANGLRLDAEAVTIGEGKCMYFAHISVDGPVKHWQLPNSIGVINPANKLIRKRKGMVVAEEATIVKGIGASACLVRSGIVGSKGSSDGHRVT